MLNRREINEAIDEIEQRENHNASAVLTLAGLYTIRDHLDGYMPEPEYEMSYSRAVGPEPIAYDGDSEFLRAVSRTDADAVWEIMDELMDTLRIVNVKVYDNVIKKIRSI